jgi:hypothetical protein
MISYLIKRILFVALIALGPAVAYAELPSGSYNVHFGQQKAVWDVSGTYHIDDFATSQDFTLIQDDKGKITGQGTGTASESGFNIQMNFTLRGAIKGSSGVTQTSLGAKYTGTATDGIQTLNVTGNIKVVAGIDDLTNQLSGTAKGKICVKGAACDAINDTIDIQIPASEDGTWDLAMDIQSVNGVNLSGTAMATLKNGRTEALALTGKYNSGTDMAQLKLKGSAGQIMLNAQFLGSVVTIQTMKAKLLGQTVSVP